VRLWGTAAGAQYLRLSERFFLLNVFLILRLDKQQPYYLPCTRIVRVTTLKLVVLRQKM